MLQGDHLQQLLSEYINEYSLIKGFSEETIRNKRDVFRRFSVFLGERAFIVTSVQQYIISMQQRKLTPNTIKTEFRNIKAFIKWLYRKKKAISEDWGYEIEIPKVCHEPENLVDAHTAEKIIFAGTEPGIFDNVNHKKRKALMRFAMRFALRTGVRGNELINIRGKDLYIDDLNPDESKVYLIKAKGGIPQWQPLPNDMLEELKQHVDDEKVFPVCIGTCNDALKRGAKIVGVSNSVVMHVHILRKIFGTTLARYLTMSKVSRLMRHSDISITQKFYIAYGISELGQDLNSYHPLIRLSLSKETVVENFIFKTALPYFDRDKRFNTPCFEYDPNKREYVVRIPEVIYS